MRVLPARSDGSPTVSIDGNEILIYHEGDWANLQDMVDMGFTNISAKLMNDVSITSSIGTRKNPFSGTFDGNGHTLNAFILNYVDAAGVFKNISGATIKNLHVTGDVHGRVCTGGIVGVVQGDNNLIENCRVSANVGGMANSSNGPHVGGFIGHGLTYTNTIRGCLFDGKLCVLQDEKLHDSYAGVFFGWCSNPSKQKVEDSMARGSFDSSLQHKGLNYDESGKSSSVQVTNTYHFQSWKEGKRAYSITCESEAFRLNYGTPVTTYGVSGIDVYDDGITQDGTFYAGDLERVSMSIAGVEGYDFSINSFVAKDASLLVDYQHPGNFIVGIAGSDVVIEVSSNLETFYIFDNERNSKRLLDIVGKFEGYDVRLSGRTLYRDGSWNTLCLPFDVSDIAGTPLEGAQVKTLEGVEYENMTLTLHFGEDLTSLEAGMPYIVRWERPEHYVAFDGNNFGSTSDLVNPLFSGVTITLSIPRYTWFDYNDDGIMDVGFRGFFNPMDVGVNHSMVYLGSDNKLYYSNGNMRVNACRAYFVLNGIFANEKGDGINNFVLNFDNGQTGISSSMVEGSGCSDETWYSMDGRRLNAKPKAKGVYVSHGKKIFIK